MPEKPSNSNIEEARFSFPNIAEDLKTLQEELESLPKEANELLNKLEEATGRPLYQEEVEAFKAAIQELSPDRIKRTHSILEAMSATFQDKELIGSVFIETLLPAIKEMDETQFQELERLARSGELINENRVQEIIEYLFAEKVSPPEKQDL